MFHPKGPSFFELARQALSSTERGYDLLASKFDYTPFRTPESVLRVVQEKLREIGPFDAGIDICCGTGAGMEVLLPICERVVGIDMSQGMLEVAEQNLKASGESTSIQFIRGNVLEMPFDGEFDLAVCFGAHGHILKRDEPEFVRQVFQALRPGGRFVFVTTQLPPIWSRSYCLSRGFNFLMRVRNLFIRPPFIMYYLTFLLPGVKTLLEQEGFDVEVHSPFSDRMRRLQMVIATRPMPAVLA
jgi:ubiquinone/menaquinone biosynthesis C-methylase UbiE